MALLLPVAIQFRGDNFVVKRKPTNAAQNAVDRKFLSAAAKAADLETDEFDTRVVCESIGIVDYSLLRDRLARIGVLTMGKTSALDRLSDKGWDLLSGTVAKAAGISKATLDEVVSAEADRLLAKNPNLLRARRKKRSTET